MSKRRRSGTGWTSPIRSRLTVVEVKAMNVKDREVAHGPDKGLGGSGGWRRKRRGGTDQLGGEGGRQGRHEGIRDETRGKLMDDAEAVRIERRKSEEGGESEGRA